MPSNCRKLSQTSVGDVFENKPFYRWIPLLFSQGLTLQHQANGRWGSRATPPDGLNWSHCHSCFLQHADVGSRLVGHALVLRGQGDSCRFRNPMPGDDETETVYKTICSNLHYRLPAPEPFPQGKRWKQTHRLTTLSSPWNVPAPGRCKEDASTPGLMAAMKGL